MPGGGRISQLRTEERTMPTYIMLSTLTPEGVQTVKNNPQRIREVNKEVEQVGATVKAQWGTLGHVDFISVVAAPDEARGIMSPDREQQDPSAQEGRPSGSTGISLVPEPMGEAEVQAQLDDIDV